MKNIKFSLIETISKELSDNMQVKKPVNHGEQFGISKQAMDHASLHCICIRMIRMIVI